MNRHFDVNVPAANKRQTGIKRETAEACRERAAADLLASATMINANQRIRLEASASIWTSRALMLQRVEDGVSRKDIQALLGDAPSGHRTRL
jgi:hypothetical protein